MNIEFEKYIKDTLEIKELGNAYQFIFDKIENEGQRLIDNQYIPTADIETIREYEHILKIPADDTLSLEERRLQVLLKFNMKPPYTFNNMIRQIRAFTGVESEITEDRENLSLNIDLTDATKGIIKLVHQYMKRIKPTNVVYSISATPQDLDDSYPFYQAVTIMQFIEVGVPNTWDRYISSTWQDVLNLGTWNNVLNSEV